MRLIQPTAILGDRASVRVARMGGQSRKQEPDTLAQGDHAPPSASAGVGFVSHFLMSETNASGISGDFSLTRQSVAPLSVALKSCFSKLRISCSGTVTTSESAGAGIHTSNSPRAGLRLPPATFTPRMTRPFVTKRAAVGW
jgi:hypothetical protein